MKKIVVCEVLPYPETHDSIAYFVCTMLQVAAELCCRASGSEGILGAYASA